jgi:hypothetical protein
MNPFTRFINSRLGRLVRIVAGAAMIGVGVAAQGDSGLILAALGLVPLTAGLFDICLMAPIFQIPWRGAKIRAMK